MKGIKKNDVEKTAERICWKEIKEVLKKHNCRLEGYASAYSEDCDMYEVATEKIVAISKSFDKRVDQYVLDEKNKQKLKAQREQKAMFTRLNKFKKFKDLELLPVDDSHYREIWFKGLSVDRTKIKEPSFNWNPNGYWQIGQSLEGLSEIYFTVRAKNKYFGANGTPHFSVYRWTPGNQDRHRVHQNVKWFEYREDVCITAYQDMVSICILLERLINEGIISLDGSE